LKAEKPIPWLIKRRLRNDKEGKEIPFPQMDIHQVERSEQYKEAILK